MRYLLASVFLLFLTTVALAQAATTVDLNPLVNQITQVLVDLAVGLVMILGSWLAFELKKKWNIDVTTQVSNLEANYRDTLHSAVETWTNAAIAKFGPNLTFNVGSPEAAYVLNGVAKSATDAVNHFKPTEQWILAKAAGVLGTSVPPAAVVVTPTP